MQTAKLRMDDIDGCRRTQRGREQSFRDADRGMRSVAAHMIGVDHLRLPAPEPVGHQALCAAGRGVSGTGDMHDRFGSEGACRVEPFEDLVDALLEEACLRGKIRTFWTKETHLIPPAMAE